MTPKEKAGQLFFKYRNLENKDSFINNYNAKQCALIAVDEIIIQWEYIDTYLSDLNGELNPNLKYWYDVKQEIEKL
jgi:hypothetical protein